VITFAGQEPVATHVGALRRAALEEVVEELLEQEHS
jgi:hypothetical protein